MNNLYIIHILCLLTAADCLAQSAGKKTGNPEVHSTATELRSFLDISSLPSYLDNTLCAQVSSYDTTGKNDDGFSGRFSYLRRNADSSLVIFDLKGSGVINRIWTPTPTMDTLDFYIDNNLKPSFSIQFMDLFSGKRYPFTGPLCGNQLGGFYCYLPIPFSKSCMIVCRGKKVQFHQIQYRLYPKDAKVRSFNPDFNNEEKEIMQKIFLLWNKNGRSINDFYSGKLSESSGQLNIEAGTTSTIFEMNNGGRILGIEMGPVKAFEGLTKDIDLRITWDGEKNPAICCPVADFFGYAFGTASMQSLLLGSNNSGSYCYFPMPFDKGAKIDLIYRKSGSASPPVQVSYKVIYSNDKRNADAEGKFYAHWNYILKSQKGKPHVFLDMKGKGHYVGTILQAQGKRPGMTLFFEGDDSVSIDGSFRIHGTGSEDYFNGGWYAMMDRWDGKMSLPIHGSLEYSLPFCRTGGYRLYLSDKLSFEKSFYQSIEHGPVGNEFPVEYNSLALYYSNTPIISYTQPSNELTKVFQPDTLIIYPQLMDYNIFGDMDIKTTWEYGTGGESYLFSPGDESWLRISLADIPQGKYKMLFDINMESNGCDFSLWQRQTQISDWISTTKPEEERMKDLYVGDLDLNGLISTLTIRFRTNPQKRSFMLHRMILIKG